MPPTATAPDLEAAGFRRLVVPWNTKAVAQDSRTFEGMASTWDLDLGGDIIHPGAFKETLAEWRSTGRVIPLLDQHNYYTIRSALGKLQDAKETKQGLWTKWSIIEGEDGDAALDRLRAGVIDSLSIGYEALKWDYEDLEDKGGFVRNLRKVGLRESSLVLFPMNPDALIDLSTVKALAASQHLTPELRRILGELKGELETLLAEPAPAQDLVDAPDPTAYDRLRLRRLGATL